MSILQALVSFIAVMIPFDEKPWWTWATRGAPPPPTVIRCGELCQEEGEI